jgi:hypothetical protein
MYTLVYKGNLDLAYKFKNYYLIHQNFEYYIREKIKAYIRTISKLCEWGSSS